MPRKPFKPGQLLLAEDLNALAKRITAIEDMRIYPDGSGNFVATGENCTLTLNDGVGGNLTVYLVVGGSLKKAVLSGHTI